jgi:uncharacterized protein (DUF983 family)
MAVETTPPVPTGGVAPFWKVVLRGRCPRCGEGGLFAGLLVVAPLCTACGLDLSGQDSGDGPAVLGIFVLGALAMIGAFLVEFRLSPPLWVHALLWPVLLIPAAVGMMRCAKAALIALQWRHRRGEGV